MLKKISNLLSTDNSIPIFGYSINEADITSASFFCVVTTLYKAVSYPLSTPPLQISLNGQSGGLSPPFPVSSNFWDMPFKKACHVCKRRGFAYVMINLEVDGGKNPTIRPRAISLSGPQQAQARCNLTCFREVYRAVITMMSNPNSGIARLSQGCFASGIPQGRHLQMPGRSWQAGKAVWRWKARRP